MKSFTTTIRKIALFFLIGFIALQPITTLAISQNDLDAILNDSVFYDPSVTGSACAIGGGGITGAVPPVWAALLAEAAAKYNVDAKVLAAVLFAENNGDDVLTNPSAGKWPDPNTSPWPKSTTSSAEGPFQFLDRTWEGFKVDADGGGASRQSIKDSAYSAAHYLANYASGKIGVPEGSASDDLGKAGIAQFDTAYKQLIGYNAGSATWKEGGLWYQPSGVWNDAKQKEITNYPIKGLIGFRSAGGANPATPATPTAGTGTGATIVVIDPGHDGTDTNTVDPTTGLKITTTTNPPERKAMWQTAQKVKSDLEALGYKIILTKNAETDTVNHRQRAETANSANSALAVSLHFDADQAFGSWGEIYTQKVGLYRGDSPKVTFSDEALASKSQQYGELMKAARISQEGSSVKLTDANFNSRTGEGKEPGNIPNVQLFSKVPWVYNETGGKGFDLNKYAQGIEDGIKQAVPSTGGGGSIPGSTCSGGGGAVAGSIVQTALNYAWDTQGHGKEMADAKPSYQEALPKFNSTVGEDVWSDCGRFVSTVMHASGADPAYPLVTTSVQFKYLRDNPGLYDFIGTNLTDTSLLQAGDIGIVNGHTFIYVDKQSNGFNTVQASLHTKVPQPSRVDYYAENYGESYSFYRRKT